MIKATKFIPLKSAQYKHINGGEAPIGYTAVAFNAPLSYFEPKTIMRNGRLVSLYKEMTTKDCRNIDNCVYFAPGKVSNDNMCDWIEKFQRAYNDPTAPWRKEEDGN